MGIAPSCADGTSTQKILANCKKNVKWKIGEGRGATDDLLRFAVRKNARFLNVLERTKVASVISDGNRINTVFSDDVWYNKSRYMLYDSYTTILPNKRIMADMRSETL